jgi:hypothetical protein
MTIREFIELQLEIYKIDESKFNAIKTKISRELKKIDEWMELEEKESVGKTTAFKLTESLRRELEVRMRPYFLKISHTNLKDFEVEKDNNRRIAFNMESEFKTHEGRNQDPYRYEIPTNEKLRVMIESLFFERFELDEESWIRDYSDYMNFADDPEILSSDGMALTTMRLCKPRKYYVKAKKRD